VLTLQLGRISDPNFQINPTNKNEIKITPNNIGNAKQVNLLQATSLALNNFPMPDYIFSVTFQTARIGHAKIQQDSFTVGGAALADCGRAG
jgi:hypothetical protein